MIPKIIPSNLFAPIGPVLIGLLYIAKGFEADPMHSLHPKSDIILGCFWILSAPLWSSNPVSRSLIYQIFFCLSLIFGAIFYGIEQQLSMVLFFALLAGVGIFIWFILRNIRKRELKKATFTFSNWLRWTVAITFTFVLLIPLIRFRQLEYSTSNIIVMAILVWIIVFCIFVKDDEEVA